MLKKVSIVLALALILALVLGTVAYAGQGEWGGRAWKFDPAQQQGWRYWEQYPEIRQEGYSRSIGNTTLDPGNTESKIKWDGARGALIGTSGDLDWMDPTEAVRELGKIAEQEGVGGPVPIAGTWYLRNGAFDQGWSNGTPTAWMVNSGAASLYGQLPMGTYNNVTWDSAFQFQFNQGGNAYLYQNIYLPGGNYWIDLHSTVFAADTAPGTWDYGYMMYYAIVPDDGSFSVSDVGVGDWRELWPYEEACDDELTQTGSSYGCSYVQRAETRTFAEGKYVFVARAQQKWPGNSWFIFDDFQIIDANPAIPENPACPWKPGPKPGTAQEGWYCKNPENGKYERWDQLIAFYGSRTDFEGCIFVHDPCTQANWRDPDGDGVFEWVNTNFRVEGGVYR
jgi:hypothetical protein